MHFFGNLGHVVVLAPVSLALIGYLHDQGARRDAVVFAVALILCLIATFAAKLFLAACDFGPRAFAIESPSGHASFSAVVYGSLALIAATGRSSLQKLWMLGGGALLVLLVGFGRVATGAHTSAEVIVGFAIGGACVALFHALRREPRRLEVPWRSLAVIAPVALAVVLVGLTAARHWTPEPLIEEMGRRIGFHFGLCA